LEIKRQFALETSMLNPNDRNHLRQTTQARCTFLTAHDTIIDVSWPDFTGVERLSGTHSRAECLGPFDFGNLEICTSARRKK